FIVARPGNDPRTVRTDRNAGDGFALDLKGFEQRSGGGVPEFGESVACPGDDLRAVGAECEAKNGPVVPETLRDELLAAGGVPHAGDGSGGRDNSPAIRRDQDAGYAA